MPIHFENSLHVPAWRFTDSDGYAPTFRDCYSFSDGWRQQVSGRWGSWWIPCAPPVDPNVSVTDPRVFADGLFREAPLPSFTVNVNPRPGLVQIENWFWLSGGVTGPFGVSGELVIPAEVGPEVPTGPVLGDPGAAWVPPDSARRRPTTRTVEVAVRTAGYVWEFGDGAPPLYTASRGQAYPQASDVAHVYRFSSFYTRGGFPVTVQAVYAANFRVDGGAWEALAPRATEPQVFRHPVQEIQTVLSVMAR